MVDTKVNVYARVWGVWMVGQRGGWMGGGQTGTRANRDGGGRI